jgi:ribosomal protein S18 acetylase RimI-like enzyme
MSDNPRQGLIKKQILTESEVTEIEQLARICNNHENLHMRIGWIRLRPQQREETNNSFFNDFLFYEDGQLAGYLVLDEHGTTARELTGMVHPEHRRKGIFTALLAAAKEESRGRGVRKLILICEDSSRSGRAFVAATGAHYDSSEYRMVLETFREKEIFDDRLFFRQANESDLEALVTILVDGFDETVEEVKSSITDSFEECQFYLATFGEASLGCKEPVGCLKLYEMQDEVGIYGFVVRSAYRGRGYGRQMLEETIRTIQASSQKQIMLEVDTQNTNAIGLYRSCGFKETTTYGYYSLDISRQGS